MASKDPNPVNNDIYHKYGDRWYTADDDPVALLRAESRTRNSWILAELEKRVAGGKARLLDLGCGAGFLTNELARHGHHAVGLDASEAALQVARRYDTTGNVEYQCGDASKLSFRDQSFDAVCAMDLLEHVSNPAGVVREASRVLKPGGLFFFYTFNRNFLCWLVVIKGVEWFVRNTPPDMHCLRYFIKPSEIRSMCREANLELVLLKGFAPKINGAFLKMLVTGRVDDRFSFRFTGHTLIGYVGLGEKQ